MYRRPIVGIAMAFILGIIVQYYTELNIKIIFAALFFLLMLFLILVRLKPKWKIIIILLSIFLLGALHIQYNHNSEDFMDSFINKKIEIIGECEQKYITDKSAYILHISDIKYKGKNYKIDSKTMLKVFNYEGKSLNNKKIIVYSKLQIPDKARNPKAFDYNLYLKTQGINTTLNTNSYNIKVIGAGNLPLFIRLRYNIKSYIYKEALKILPGNEGQVALSIVFGDKKIIDENIYNSFKESGTAHALAVSGLHFGILFVFFNSIFKIFKIKETHKSLILIFLIWFFAFIVGLSPSVVRASSMITLGSVSNLINRKYDIFTSLALICLINVLINPFMIFNVGFQLSFLAVISIALFYNPIFERIFFLPEILRKMVSATLAAQIGTSLIMAYHFNTFSPISLIINIPVVLLITGILPLNLIFFIALFINSNIAKFIAFFDQPLIKLLIKINSISSYIPFSNFNVVSPTALFFVIFYFCVIIIFCKNKIPYINKYKRKKLLLIMLIITLGINGLKWIYPNKLKLTFVDVGQGDCILIETPKGKNILIDGGEYKEDFLSELLLKNHISYIDLICLTHIHNDHIGGIIDVVKNIRAGSIVIGTKAYSSKEYLELVKQCNIKSIPVMEFAKGKVIKLEKDLTLTSIHPTITPLIKTNDDTNNNSLVCILKYKDFQVLLTGDIEKEAESEIIREVIKTDVDVIKICHHGSQTSSTTQFIDYFNPEIAVIQVGKNTFGHPHKNTLDTLNKRKIKIYRNDINGAVIIKYDGKNIEIDTMLE